MTVRGLENNASPKAVLSGDDFQFCFQPVLPQCHFEFCFAKLRAAAY